jgi:hypothetical protein
MDCPLSIYKIRLERMFHVVLLRINLLKADNWFSLGAQGLKLMEFSFALTTFLGIFWLKFSNLAFDLLHTLRFFTNAKQELGSDTISQVFWEH